MSESMLDQNSTEQLSSNQDIEMKVNEQQNDDISNENSKVGELNSEEVNDDLYKYLQLDEYSSERYKLEIQNLHKFCTHSEVKKLFKSKFNLNVKKVKIIEERNKRKYAYISVVNEEEREKAIKLVNGYLYKGQKLKVIKAKPAPDPRILSRNNAQKKNQINYDELTEQALQEHLLNQVCPSWKDDYTTCQLQEKQNSHRKLLEGLIREITKIHRNNQNDNTNSSKLVDYDKNLYLKRHQTDLNQLYGGIRTADQYINGYRNKCECTVSKDTNGRTVVGFRLGAYSDNKVKVVRPTVCPLLNDRMIKMIDLFEQFMNSPECALKPFDVVNHEGHVKHIVIRTTGSGCMLIVNMNSTGLKEEELANEINKLKQYFELQSKELTSLYVECGKLQKAESKAQNVFQHVYGDLYLIEKMRNDELQFRISPLAFFQINVKACEILHQSIADLAGLDENCIVLDICCGVGTIGISLAHKVKHVIGIELIKEAVDDARYNAKLNNISNIEFVAGQAEDQMAQVIQKAKRIENSIIKVIRMCNEITKLIYVSCEPRFSRQNLIDFCKPPTKSYPGMPFNIQSALSVDMFPHTSMCELITLFNRQTKVPGTTNSLEPDKQTKSILNFTGNSNDKDIIDSVDVENKITEMNVASVNMEAK